MRHRTVIKIRNILYVCTGVLLSSCSVKPGIGRHTENSTGLTSCFITNNYLYVLKNADSGELYFSNNNLLNDVNKISGSLIVRQKDKIYHFKNNANIIFSIDGEEYILQTSAVSNKPISQYTLYSTGVGIFIPSEENYTVTTYKFLMEQKLFKTLAEARYVSIKIEMDRPVNVRNDVPYDQFIEFELKNENLQIITQFSAECLRGESK